MPSGSVGSYRFFIRMPDGTVHKINDKKNMNEVIKPFLLRYSEFKTEYKGEFKDDEYTFMEMIKLYNSLCD